MNSTPFKSSVLRWIGIAGLLAAGGLTPATAQLSVLKKVVEAQPPAAATPAAETPDQARTRLEQWLQEARDTLARLEVPGAAAALPQGITPEELDERRRDLEQMVLTLTRSLKNIAASAAALKDLETARAEDAAWTGFKEKPPYPLPMIDDLLNDQDATEAKLASHQSSLANSTSLLANAMAELKTAEDSASGLLVAWQNATGPATEAAKWRLEAARAKSRLLAERAGFMQSRCEILKNLIAATQLELALLERKVKTAKANARFNEEDLTKITKTADARKQALQKEITAISKQLKAAVTTRSQAQAGVDAVASPPAGETKPDGLELAKYRLEVAEERVDALQAMVEGLESLVLLENLGVSAHQSRRAFLTASRPQDRAKALEALANLRERLWAWENVVDDELTNSSATLNKLETRASTISPEDPRFKLLDDQRAITNAKLAMLQRMSQAVVLQRHLVKRWVLEYAPPPTQAGFFERLAIFANSTWTTVKKIWGFEVMSFENNKVVEGLFIPGKIPVTLGLLLRALLFFTIGYWLTSRLANRVEASLVGRGHVAEAQARTLRNWAMIVCGVFLAIGTLAFLKIPLTVFAFFGGALAIGLGFGMQTLIKNFISGIIVLAERKVRVGDILDVDGIVGTVTEINTRSSVIRSPDEVETMIPNSVFLENRVTNWTLSSTRMRRNLRVGIAYGTPPSEAIAVLTESAARHGLVRKDPAPFVVLEDFGDNALVFQLYFWVDLKPTTNAMIVTSDLRLMIEKRFTEAGICVPFPQRDIHLTTAGPLQVQLEAPAPPQAPA